MEQQTGQHFENASPDAARQQPKAKGKQTLHAGA
jgi:hypothetical protein